MITITRFLESEESLTRQIHGLCDVTVDGKIVYRCSTLERAWFPRKTVWSCLPPSPETDQDVYNVTKENTFGNTQYQHLSMSKDGKTWPLKIEKSAPIFFGQNLVYCEATGLYEFKDHREALVAISKLLPPKSKMLIKWTAQPNIVAAKLSTKSIYFEDDSLPTYPIFE